jgi:hypothetical protein
MRQSGARRVSGDGRQAEFEVILAVAILFEPAEEPEFLSRYGVHIFTDMVRVGNSGRTTGVW